MAETAVGSGAHRAATITEKHPAVPLTLAFCSAFVDVTCYVGLFRTFTAFITGTLIVLSSELFRNDGLPWIRVTVLACFFAGVVMSFLGIREMLKADRAVVKICLAVESLLILLFMVTAATLPPHDDLFALGTTLAVVFATAAMALQNTVMVTLLPFHKPTTIMTGNFVRVVVHAMELTIRDHRHGEHDGLPPPEKVDTHWIFLAFVVGGVTGGACIAFVGFWGLILPAAALAIVSAMLPRRPVTTTT
jgi:uncharacterized membrane protein YoaK (UPF0700 family)